MKKIAHWFITRTWSTKASILISIDILFAVFSLWLAFSLRLGEWYVPKGKIWILFAISPLLIIPIFIRLGLYRAIIRYIGGRVLWAIFQAVSFYAVTFTVVVFLTGIGLVPRTVPLLNWMILLFLISGNRFIARWWLTETCSDLEKVLAKDYCQKIVVIYGAGYAGAQLASALTFGQEFRPVAFLDDNKLLQRHKVNGLRIYSLDDLNYLINRHKITDVLLALPSASRRRRYEIIRSLEKYSIHVRTMPSLSDAAQGKINFNELQEVDIADLLGRDAVDPEYTLFHANIDAKIVLITGAGGSIGSELCRQIIKLEPAKVILFELNEFALYSIEKELNNRLAKKNKAVTFEIIALLGSVTDAVRIDEVCRTFKVNTIYHTAAYKHVPMVEQNPGEAVKNNIFGTLNIAHAAINNHVETFVLISTDKAVRPTNTMGATKRYAELILQALSSESGHSTRFTMVRFGNVLGSSGSVIPLFREQIAKGGPVTVTDAQIIRYFMTIPEAAQLVIQAGALGEGGDVFVLDMGDPIRIVDLATRMIHLSGLEVKDDDNPEGEIEISYTGLRPGEKLYEELLIGANVSETVHCRIMRAEEEIVPWDELDRQLNHLQTLVDKGDFEGIRGVLKQSVSGFIPQCDVSDLLHQARKNQIKEDVSG